jgi:ABC-2 type transport system permease protein
VRRFAQVTGAVWWRATHTFLTNPQFLLPSIMFPLFFFTAFAGGLSSLGDVPGFDFPSGYTAFQFCFVLLQASAFGGVFTGFGIASDFENGFARRLMLGAPNRSAILVGYLLTALTRAAVVLCVVTIVALLGGMAFDGGPLDVFGMFALAVIVSLAATLFAAGVALRARTIQAGPAMQMPVFLALFLAPVYVPLDLLSGWVQTVARGNPVTPLIEAARGFVSGGDADIALAAPVAVGLVVVFAAWALRGLRRAEAAGS